LGISERTYRRRGLHLQGDHRGRGPSPAYTLLLGATEFGHDRLAPGVLSQGECQEVAGSASADAVTTSPSGTPADGSVTGRILRRTFPLWHSAAPTAATNGQRGGLPPEVSEETVHPISGDQLEDRRPAAPITAGDGAVL
jgi:hypothetical protein